VFTALEVSSRLWVGLVVGSRTYKNVKRCLFDVLPRGRVYSRFLFTTDGFDVYAPQEVPLGCARRKCPWGIGGWWTATLWVHASMARSSREGRRIGSPLSDALCFVEQENSLKTCS